MVYGVNCDIELIKIWIGVENKVLCKTNDFPIVIENIESQARQDIATSDIV